MGDDWVLLTDEESEQDEFLVEPEGERGVGHDLPIRPAAIPGWVQEFGNGKIPLEKMDQVVPGAPAPAKFLLPEAGERWRAFQAAAAAAGFDVRCGGGYRTYEQQEAEFSRRYGTTPTTFGDGPRTWKGVKYYLQSPKTFAMSSPGKSNHGWGCAIDMAMGDGNYVTPAFLSWAKDVALSYGFSWENYEKHHIRLVRPEGAPPATAAPTTFSATSTPTASDLPVPELRLGSSGAEVMKLQRICLTQGWGDCGRADGEFGPRTEVAVKVLQTTVGATSDGVYGPRSAARLKEFMAR